MKKITLIITLTFTSLQVFSLNSKIEVKQQQVLADTLKKDGIDPVCKMKVKAGHTKTAVFNKITYGFCSESCKKSFAANPKKYVKK